ncbi:MAG: DUF2608 domain-containing protein [Candidatus Babeliales bacterium]|nr:DUF2608 domain-containing protein [Candidatus Babeliales bacterium]
MKKVFLILIFSNVLILNQKAADPNVPVYNTSIIELGSYNQIEEELCNLDRDTLVLFDIDETLIDAAHMICKLKFIEQKAIFDFKYLNGLKVSAAFNKALDKKCLTEPKIKDIIRHLQAKKVTVLGLTSRHAVDPQANYTAESTYSVLRDLGIDFHNDNFENFNITDIQQIGVDSKFYNGIIFTGGTLKGYALYSFLAQTGLRPKKIIFFDDKLEHLKDFKKMIDTVNKNNIKAGNHGFEFTGYHYKFVENRQDILDEEIVQYQGISAALNGCWIDDQKAADIVKRNKQLQA